jgi:hypothetical protein
MALHSFEVTELIRRAQEGKKARERFKHREFSELTIGALINNGIDAPEVLLSMSNAQVRTLRNIGPVSLREITDYRIRYRPK